MNCVIYEPSLLSRASSQGRNSARFDHTRWMKSGKPDRMIVDGPSLDHRESPLGMHWMNGYAKQWRKYKNRPKSIALIYAVITLDQ